MPSTTEGGPADWAELPRQRRALVVVDVVESVRLMQAHEDDVIDRWRRFVREVRTKVLPAYEGRMVKSLGDGMLLEFAEARQAVKAAFDMQACIQTYNLGRQSENHLALRVGLHVADVVVDRDDLFGAGVNLVARVASVAEPGGVVASAEAVDALIIGHDVEVEDMGEVYLKHLHHPLRLYRLDGAPACPPLPIDRTPLQPLLLIAPFTPLHAVEGAADCHGELVADALHACLGRNGAIRVISKLSSHRLADRLDDLQMLSQRMKAGYVLTGRHHLQGGRLGVQFVLRDARSHGLIAEGRIEGAMTDLFRADGELVLRIAADVQQALIRSEVARAVEQPLPSLHSAALLLGAIALMHRQSAWAFQRAGEMLAHLCERHPRHAAPCTWRAKWHVIALAQGWSAQPERDRSLARSTVEQALTLEPDNALAWSIRANARAYLDRDHAAARQDCERALAINPSEPLAWLYLGMISGWQGESQRAREGADQALALSPLDPMHYYFDVLAAGALLGADDLVRSEQLARRSMRSNREHLATHKILTIVLSLREQGEAARAATQELMQREPGFSVAQFRALSPWGASPQGPRFCDALAAAGVPLH